MQRRQDGAQFLLLLNFNEKSVDLHLPVAGGNWRKLLDSADPAWSGPGASAPERLAGGEKFAMPGSSCVLFRQEPEADGGDG
jgi:maltooligosyltrehalose trehalohydrolase